MSAGLPARSGSFTQQVLLHHLLVSGLILSSPSFNLFMSVAIDDSLSIIWDFLFFPENAAAFQLPCCVTSHLFPPWVQSVDVC